MNLNDIIDRTQQFLGSRPLAVYLAIKLRNQCRGIIKYYLNSGSNHLKNGEAWLARQAASNSFIFIDVGANVGNWTHFFREAASGNVKGLLFEPSQQAVEKLRQRFQQVDEIEILEYAVSDEVGEMYFYEEPNAGETSSLVASFSHSTAAKKIVQLTTIDIEVEKRNWEYIDFLKIDAEGYDFHVLRGASNLLCQERIGIIQFEYNSPWALVGSTLGSALRFLNSFGYKIFLLKETGLFELRYEIYGEYFEYSNFVAIAPNRQTYFQAFVRGYI